MGFYDIGSPRGNDQHPGSPDYDDSFTDAVADEAAAQIKSDNELLATLLAERIQADDIKLLQSDDAAAFSVRCKELLADAIEDYIGTVLRRVNETTKRGSVGYMVQRAIGGAL